MEGGEREREREREKPYVLLTHRAGQPRNEKLNKCINPVKVTGSVAILSRKGQKRAATTMNLSTSIKAEKERDSPGK